MEDETACSTDSSQAVIVAELFSIFIVNLVL